MKIVKYVFLSGTLLIACCGKNEADEGQVSMPEVNDKNCLGENVRSLPPSIQKEFSSLCLRRSSFKESEPKAW